MRSKQDFEELKDGLTVITSVCHLKRDFSHV